MIEKQVTTINEVEVSGGYVPSGSKGTIVDMWGGLTVINFDKYGEIVLDNSQCWLNVRLTEWVQNEN